MKPVPEQVDNIRRGDAAAYNPDALTPESHRSSASRSLKQLIAATLRSGMEHTNNTISHHQGAASAGQCFNNMDLIPPPDDLDVQIIGGESNYWQDWEDEVHFNSGRTHARETIPPHPGRTNDEIPGQLVVPKLESESRFLLTEHSGEYVEEHCDDPLADKKE